jgi:hypothetical protein
MLIRSSVPFARRLTAAAAQNQKPAPQSGGDDDVSFKETALKSTVVGASLGTVFGEKLGGAAFVASGGYLGWKAGQSLAGEAGGLLGAALGAGAAYFTESKVPVGQTLGSVGGFLTGGILGGVTGLAIGGAQAVAHSKLFEKG